jgi:MFS family permease
MRDGSPFSVRDFRLLLLGQTTSQLGAQVSGVAIPLLAVLVLHASPFQLGVINAAGTLGFAVIGLPAGAWIDRWRRRPVLISSDIIRGALLTTVPLAWLLGILTIWQLVTVSMLVGLARVFFDVGYPSYLPTVIGKDKLLAGNSLMEAIRAFGQVLGPGLGGWLVAVAGAANVVLVQAAAFAISAVSLLSIRVRESPPVADPGRPRLRTQIKQGLLYVANNRILRATAMASAAANFGFAIASAVTFIFLSDVLRLGAAAIGILLALGSVTVIAGAALTPRLARHLGTARVIWLPLAITGPIMLLGALARPGWLVALIVIGSAAGEFGQIIYSITSLSLRQRICPEGMLGRVNSTMRFAILGLFPLGALVGGTLGELVGLRVTLWIALGLVAIAPTPVYLALRHLRDIEEIPA